MITDAKVAGSLPQLLRSAFRGGLVGAWHAWRLARIERRLGQVERWRSRERAMHDEQLDWLRAEEAKLLDARTIATQQAATYWRAVR